MLVLWWLLTAMLLAVLVVVTLPRSPEIVRLGPAEDDPADRPLAVDLAPRIHLAPAEEGLPAPDRAELPGLFVATGGLPLPLRAGPDRSASVLVQVPDGAVLEYSWRAPRTVPGAASGGTAGGLDRRRRAPPAPRDR